MKLVSAAVLERWNEATMGVAAERRRAIEPRLGIHPQREERIVSATAQALRTLSLTGRR